ncbi:alpha/beta hydrolase family protein [Fictibacillus iocasae]|uniref:Alpha/beta hydrolase family protein n=1 Tax=Fictibacillus iocasae TaxID=2715437 RepID=A0ABW2NTT9_9BACL
MKNGTIIEKQRFPSPNPRIRLYRVTYMSSGLKVKGLLALPNGSGPFPGLIYLRGGIKKVGMVRIPRIVQFASQGFAVMAPYYRGNEGGEGNEDFAGDDREDAFSALELLKQLPNVDSEDMHVFGFSRGGPMALFTAIKYPEIKSAVTWGGVTDMALTYEEREDMRRMMKRVIGGTPEKFQERYRWRSPVYDCEKLNVPLLMIHGMRDDNVSVEHTLTLKRCLTELDKPHEAWIYPQFHHAFPPLENRKITRALCEWMKSHNK